MLCGRGYGGLDIVSSDYTSPWEVPILVPGSSRLSSSQGFDLLLLLPYSTFIMSLTSSSCPATTVALADRSNPVTGRPPGSVR